MEYARREILIGEAIRRVEESAKPEVSAVRTKYEENKSKYTEGDKVTASHIMVLSEKETKDLVEKLDRGENFVELAKRNTPAPPSVRSGKPRNYERG